MIVSRNDVAPTLEARLIFRRNGEICHVEDAEATITAIAFVVVYNAKIVRVWRQPAGDHDAARSLFHRYRSMHGKTGMGRTIPLLNIAITRRLITKLQVSRRGA